jgi:hypothetical protein
MSPVRIAWLPLALGLMIALSAAARAEEGEDNFEQLGEKLYYNRPLTPEDEALIRKAAERWGESEVRAAAVIVAAWLEKQGKSLPPGSSGETESRPAGSAAESWLDYKLVALLAGLGAVELAVLVIYLTWWRRNRSGPPPPFLDQDMTDGPGSVGK